MTTSNNLEQKTNYKALFSLVNKNLKLFEFENVVD
jgi:hypothetical protein